MATQRFESGQAVRFKLRHGGRSGWFEGVIVYILEGGDKARVRCTDASVPELCGDEWDIPLTVDDICELVRW